MFNKSSRVCDTVYIHTGMSSKKKNKSITTTLSSVTFNNLAPCLFTTAAAAAAAITSQDCLLSMILRMASLRAWWTKGVAVAFMYCSISVLASVVALNSVVASSTWVQQW